MKTRTAIQTSHLLEIIPLATLVISCCNGIYTIEDSNTLFETEFPFSKLSKNDGFKAFVENNFLDAELLISKLEDYIKQVENYEIPPSFEFVKWEANTGKIYKISIKLFPSTEAKNSLFAFYFNPIERNDFTTIFQGSADAIFSIIDSKTLQFLYISEQVQSILGYSCNEWLSSPTFWQDHIHPEDKERAVNFCKNETALYRNHKFEYRIYDVNNNIVWIKDIVSLKYTEEGDLRLVGIMIDITASKIIDEQLCTQSKELENSLKKLNQILDQSLDIICTFDDEGRFVAVNHAVKDVLGYTPEEMIGKTYFDFVNPEDILAIEEAIEKMKTQTSLHNFEADYFSKSGKLIPILWSVKKEPVENLFYAVGKDISDRKKTELELLKLYENLQQTNLKLTNSNDQLEKFIYVASHDLLEPLRMITSFLHLIEKKYENQLNQKINKYIHFASDGAMRMRQIIIDLLEYSKIGKEDYELEQVDLNVILANIQILCRKEISKKNAIINFSGLPILTTQSSLIRQVFLNLIDNALKYCSDETQPIINIQYQVTKKELIISIKDNGIGIPADQNDKVFNLFHRLHPNDKYSGTGVGLAMTKKTIEHLQGKIWVVANKTVGSTFNFSLPISCLSQIIIQNDI